MYEMIFDTYMYTRRHLSFRGNDNNINWFFSKEKAICPSIQFHIPTQRQSAVNSIMYIQSTISSGKLTVKEKAARKNSSSYFTPCYLTTPMPTYAAFVITKITILTSTSLPSYLCLSRHAIAN